MTRTGGWLGTRRARLGRRTVVSELLAAAGGVLVLLAFGVVLGRIGVYQRVPAAVLPVWGLVVAGLLIGARRIRRRSRAVDPNALADAIEHDGGLRRGFIGGMTTPPRQGSPALIAAADTRAHRWLATHGDEALGQVRARSRRRFGIGASVGMAGLLVFVATGPTGPGGRTFWRPAALLAASWSGVSLKVDQTEVLRGATVRASVSAPGRAAATLFTRAPGEAWTPTAVSLDTAGRAEVPIGPLDADRFVRAVAGRHESRTIRIQVAVPAFLADLSMVARFPTYLDRSDEPLVSGDSVLVPAGTRLVVNGRATVPLEAVVWHRDRENVTGVDRAVPVDEHGFAGETRVDGSGRWTLQVTPRDRPRLDEPQPVLFLTVVRDSVPVITVPVPGADTVAPPNLRQPLVVDVRDDHGLSLVVLDSWLSSGDAATPRVDSLFVPERPVDRAVLSWILDLNGLGLTPGDTMFYRVRAADNRPPPQQARSRVYALALPSRARMRQAIRDQAREMAAEADSLAREQEALTEETDAQVSRSERENANGDSGLDFEEAERAGEIGDEQQALMDRADSLTAALQELAEQSWEAGMTDPEWHRQLAELQELLEQAQTPEMDQAVAQLREAIQDLDPEAVREALEQLAARQEKLEEQMERSRELFERAALEGAMSTLADDTEELADRQEEWNGTAAEGAESDSSLAGTEEALRDEAQRLADELDRLQPAMEQAGESQDASLEQAAQQMGEVGEQMQQAADQAQQGRRQEAQQSGQQASQQLEPVSQGLQEQLKQLREQWQDEVLQEMDRAMVETADLAERQEALAQRMAAGDASDETRGEQAAMREAVDQVIQRLQDAAGKNALVSPNLSTALGFSRLKMSEALSQFEQASPNMRQGAELAAQAVDGLNAVAAALARNRGDVENSSSGSGMAEAMQQMAEMASQQESLNGETGSIMPLMPQGGEQLLQQLQQVAQQQQALGQQLEEMAAEEGLPGATEELAEEALALAEELAQGQLDQETLDRQEQLFRRLLDAGRSLRSDEEDEREERQSETASQDLTQAPDTFDPSAYGTAVRYPYPTWEQLRRFSPEQRRIILDYFRRLNAGGR